MRRWLLIIVVCLGFCRGASATLSFEAVTWESGTGDTLGWNDEYSVATVTSPNTGGNPATGGFLQMYFPSALVPEPDSMVTVGDVETDDYTLDDLYLTFDFLGYPGLGEAYGLFFKSSSGSRYATTFTVSAREWQPQQISFAEAAGWGGLESPSEVFSVALANVAMIGITVQPSNISGESYYGLDNWQLATPEPGVVAMCIVIVLSVGLTAGRHIRGTASPIGAEEAA